MTVAARAMAEKKAAGHFGAAWRWCKTPSTGGRLSSLAWPVPGGQGEMLAGPLRRRCAVPISVTEVT